MIEYAQLEADVNAAGFVLVGAFAPTEEDGVPQMAGERAAGAVAIIGSAGPDFWRTVRGKLPDGAHPLDRWTRATLEELAARYRAGALFPFGGPPHLPFQRWAQRADPHLQPSPLGLLIHPEYGLWLGLRGALLFGESLEMPEQDAVDSPCLTCSDKPCLSTCPVGAFRPGRYEVPDCLAYLATLSGQPCMTLGCAARRACPVGRAYAHLPEQAQLHMRAFRAGPGSGRS